MRRVMIIGQPGSGKSTLARDLGAITKLPVYHIDQIHWMPGWVERPGPEKDRLCAQVVARADWIFEGGRSVAWPDRLARADTLIWLDIALATRGWRVFKRTLRHYGRTRPDLPENCPERFNAEFTRWIWNTRHTGRALMHKTYHTAPADKTTYHLRSRREVVDFTANLRDAVKQGNLGIVHR